MRATILLLVCLTLAIVGLSRLSFNVEITELLPEDLPESAGIRQLYAHFSRDDELIVTLAGADPEDLEAATRTLAERLAAREDVVASIVWRLPFEEQPELGADLLAWLWLNASPESTEALAAGLSPTRSSGTLADALEDLASGFLDESILLRGYDPLGLTALPGGLRQSLGVDDALFASADGTFRVLYLTAPRDDFASYREVDAWIAAVRAEIDAWRSERPGAAEIAVELTGEPAFVAEISTVMERDMRSSIIATTLLICALFWLWYRRVRPLLWLALMLGLIFSATFAAGGIVFGKLSVMSIGFAAILLGLAVDYGVVLFRERNAAPGDAAGLRRVIGPSIVWAAATTAAVFATLNLSSLPGIAELGTLVAIGTVIGALVMLGLFAPVAARDAAHHPDEVDPVSEPDAIRALPRRLALGFTGIALAAAITTLTVAGPPGLRRDAKPFQLRDSKALAALERMEARLGDSAAGPPALPVVVTADSWEQLAGRLGEAGERLARSRDQGAVRDFLLPTALAPNPRHQTANRTILRRLTGQRDRLVAEILDAGFTEEATALTRAVMDAWAKLPAQPGDASPTLPRSQLARWLVGRAISGPEDDAGRDGEASHAAVGRVRPVSLTTDANGHLAWAREINAPGIQVTGWNLLNPALQALVARDFRRVFLPMGIVLVLMLVVVFRNIRDLLLALGTLAFSGLGLMMLTRWLPAVEWNTFNIAALPILFGTGLDYSIHMIFALRRSGGALAPVRRGISQALLFCGLSTAAGFGSLAFASSEGLASLGLVCALGILLNMLSAIWLLPHWWRWSHRVAAASAPAITG